MSLKNVVVTWVDPPNRVDGSALPAAQIASFNLYARANSATDYLPLGISAVGSATSAVVPNLSPGTYNFAVSAVDTDGQESAISPGSNIITVVAAPPPPNAPNNVGATLV